MMSVILKNINVIFNKGEIPEDDYSIPFGQADIKERKDVTIIATPIWCLKHCP